MDQNKSIGGLSRRAALLAAPALALPFVARAQGGFPNRPIRIIVPFPAGGATDLTARVIAERMPALLGQPGEPSRFPVVVDNRPGAGGNLGSDLVAKALPLHAAGDARRQRSPDTRDTDKPADTLKPIHKLRREALRRLATSLRELTRNIVRGGRRIALNARKRRLEVT